MCNKTEEEEEENVKFQQVLTRFYFLPCRHPVHRSIQTCSALISDISSFPTFLEFYPGAAWAAWSQWPPVTLGVNSLQ